MKKLNIKRLAAIGAGAVLLGAAASAAFTDLTKGDVINTTTGVPAVSIVGGSNAAVSDFVWAGNIAAKVAQLATTPQPVTQGTGGEGGTPTDLTVDLTVGGTRTFTGGVREFQSIALNSVSNSTEYYDTIGNNYFKQFFNGTVNRTIDNNASVSMSIVENIGITADGRFDPTTATTHDLVAIIDPSDMNYTVAFSPGIPYSFTDSGSDDYIPVYFLGKSYLLDSINSTATQVVLIKDGADQTLLAGDTFGAIGRDGKNYTVRFDGGATAGTTDIAKFSLLDDQDVVVATINNATANGDLIFRVSGQEVLSTKARIPANGIAKTTVDNSTIYSVQIILGTGRIELQSGYEVPYDSSSTHTNIPWVASFTTSGTNLTGITIKNSNYYFSTTSPLYAVQSFGAATHTTEFEFFKDTGLDKVGTFKFQGFYDAGVQKSKVEFLKGTNAAIGTSGTASYGAIHYYDTAGQEHYIPMAILLTATASNGGVLTFDGWQQSYWTNSQTTITNLAIENDSASLPLTTADYNVTVITSDVNWESSAVVSLKGKGGSNSYKYLAYRGVNSNQVWLLLVGGSQSSGDTANYSGYIGTMQYSTGDIFLLGTSLNDANIVANETIGFFERDHLDVNNSGDSNQHQRPYYWPDTYDLNATNTGSTTGIYRTAIFKVHESLGSSDTTLNSFGSAPLFTVYIDTESGNAGTVDTAGIGGGGKQNWTGTLTGGPSGVSTVSSALHYQGTDQNLSNLSEYTGSTANYLKAFSRNGAKIELASRNVSITLPNTAMKAYFTVESTGVTTETTGGESLTDLNVGSVGETPSGTKVTIDNITGTCAVGSGACTPATYDKIVPVDSLVYTDEATPTGPVVIVGGYFVNSLAENLTLGDGSTLQDALTASGDYVAEKLDNGDIVVAGYTASDTGRAAQELIDALDALLS